MPSDIVRIGFKIKVNDEEKASLVEALIYEHDTDPNRLIGRTLANLLLGKHANEADPERLWVQLFGEQLIGFDINPSPDLDLSWVRITDFQGMANPALIGKLIQITLTRHLPLVFTYASENPDHRDRYSGGCVIVTDGEVMVRDARLWADQTRRSADER